MQFPNFRKKAETLTEELYPISFADEALDADESLSQWTVPIVSPQVQNASPIIFNKVYKSLAK